MCFGIPSIPKPKQASSFSVLIGEPVLRRNAFVHEVCNVVGFQIVNVNMLKFARHHPSPTGSSRRSNSVDRAGHRLVALGSHATSSRSIENVVKSSNEMSTSRRSRTSSLERVSLKETVPSSTSSPVLSTFTLGTAVMPQKQLVKISPSSPSTSCTRGAVSQPPRVERRSSATTSSEGVRTASIVTTTLQRAMSPPPPLPQKTFSPASSTLAKQPLVSPQHSDVSIESNYEAIFSGTLCRVSETSSSVNNTLKGSLKRESFVTNQLYEPQSEFHKNIVKLVEKLDLQLLDTSSESGYGSDQDSINNLASQVALQQQQLLLMQELNQDACPPPLPRRGSRPRSPRDSQKLKKTVRFDSYVMLLQGLRERNLEVVRTHIREVCDEALETEEVVNEFLTAVIEGNEPIIREMLANGFNVNSSDPAGMTPLHLAATFNYLPLVRLLLSHGAAVFARTHSSGNVPSELSSRRLPGFQACHAYLRCMEECLGVANSGRVHVTQVYRTSRCDELGVLPGESLKVLRKGDYPGSSWWWCENSQGQQGYVLQDLLSLNKSTANILK